MEDAIAISFPIVRIVVGALVVLSSATKEDAPAISSAILTTVVGGIATVAAIGAAVTAVTAGTVVTIGVVVAVVVVTVLVTDVVSRTAQPNCLWSQQNCFLSSAHAAGSNGRKQLYGVVVAVVAVLVDVVNVVVVNVSVDPVIVVEETVVAVVVVTVVPVSVIVIVVVLVPVGAVKAFAMALAPTILIRASPSRDAKATVVVIIRVDSRAFDATSVARAKHLLV